MKAFSRTVRRTFYLLFFCGVLAVLPGCTDNIWRGQVATVNGKPITLDQVTALRNSTHFDWVSSPSAELEVMRKQYGDALSNLVVVELVKQHLVKKKLAVTDREALDAENVIRADYPEGTFEDVLVGEAIDLETWRFLLHNHLSVQRFLEKILKPDIVITPEEADAYLKAHPDEFVRPPWAYFFLVSGTDRDEVAACAKDLDDNSDPIVVQQRHPSMPIRTVRLDVNRLDPVFGKMIARMQPGDLSPLFELAGESHKILLLGKLPERQAEPGETYAQIEEILMSRKLQDEYNAWIRNRLQKATIKVSHQLLPHLRSAAAPAGG